jgi:hypothetical protein
VKGAIISAPEGLVKFQISVASTGQVIGSGLLQGSVTTFLTYGQFKVWARPSDTLIVTLLGNSNATLPIVLLLTNFEIEQSSQYGGTD